MAVLTDQNRKEVWEDLMRNCSDCGDTISSILKAELRTFINETDSNLDTTDSTYKSGLSEPCKTNLTAKQIAYGRYLVAKKRWEVE